MIASDRITVRVDGAGHRSAKTAAIVGHVCTGLVALFLAFDTVLKVLRLGPAVEGTIALGYPANSVHWIGIIELVCLVLYLVPRSSVLGGLLLTGYLGGAIATHVRISSPWFTHTLFPVYVALLLWGGLYLREKRLRALVPLKTPEEL
jgi:DoxX-like family